MKEFKCMLAKKLDKKKLSFPCYVSPKLDGIRAQFYKGAFYTRNKKLIKGVEHIIKELKVLQNLGVSIDGELMVPGKPFQESSGLIRSFNPTPEAKFYVFDLPYSDEPLFERLNTLVGILNDLKPTSIEYVPHSVAYSLDEVHKYYSQFRRMGYEGAMVKNQFGLYENKRSAAWMKIKEIETYDVKCVGFFEGNGRLASSLGGIIVELDNVEVRVGGGFSDLERETIWNNKLDYLGRICEIAGQELTPGGSLRHPRFLKWRDDL